MASTSAESANRPKLAPSPFSVPADLPKLPEVPGTDPTRCVLDSFRIAIAKVVADALEPLTVEQVFQGVDYGKKGEDFTVALPRFRLPGKVDDLAKKVIDKVRLLSHIHLHLILCTFALCSLPILVFDDVMLHRTTVLGLGLLCFCDESTHAAVCTLRDDIALCWGG